MTVWEEASIAINGHAPAQGEVWIRLVSAEVDLPYSVTLRFTDKGERVAATAVLIEAPGEVQARSFRDLPFGTLVAAAAGFADAKLRPSPPPADYDLAPGAKRDLEFYGAVALAYLQVRRRHPRDPVAWMAKNGLPGTNLRASSSTIRRWLRECERRGLIERQKPTGTRKRKP